MRAVTKSEMADAAGVTVKTLMAWCRPYEVELRALGLRKNDKVLKPRVAQFIADTFCIDI